MDVPRVKRSTRAGITQGVAVLAGIAAAAALPHIGGGPVIQTSSIIPVMLGLAGAVFGAITVIYSVLFLVIQWVASTFTPRLTLFRDAPVVWRTAALAIGIIVFSIGSVLFTADRSQVTLAIPIVAITLVLLLLISARAMLSHALTATQISHVLVSISDRGRVTLATAYPSTDDEDSRDTESTEHLPDRTVDVRWTGAPMVLQRLRLNHLVDLATDSGSVVRLNAPMGSTLRTGESIATIYGGSLPAAKLLAQFVGGPERTFEQDPLLAFRLLADIGLRAMSPAVNDPASAVQALDELEYLLAQAMPITGRSRSYFDDDGAVRLIISRPSWFDMLHTAIDDLLPASLRSPLVLESIEGVLGRLHEKSSDDAQRAELSRRLAWVRAERSANFPELVPPQ